MSRPTASQCPRRTSILWAISVERAHPVPHVGVAGDRPQGLLLAAAADHDRQVLLDRQRAVAQVVERVVAARLGGHRLAVEQPPHRADRFVEPVEPLAEAAPELDAVGGVLGLHPRAADAEDRPAVADVIERRGGLGDEPGVAERVGADQQAEPGLLGLARPGVEQRPALEDRLVRVAEDRVEVVPRPEVGVAEPVDPLGGLEHLGPGRGLAPEQDPELDIGHGWASEAVSERPECRPRQAVARSPASRLRRCRARGRWRAG